MSNILKKFSVFSTVSEEIKRNIQLFYIFDEEKGKNILFVTNEDQVFSFGSNSIGKCGFGHNKRVDVPEKIPELCGKQIKEFFNGSTFVLALNQQNQVFGWGKNDRAQLARGFACAQFLKPDIIPQLKNIISISCGDYHSLALDSEGNLFGWGYNDSGQVGCKKELGSFVNNPVQLNLLPKLKSINCFEWKSFAISSDGMVYSWGYNWDYCLGHNSKDNIFEPKLIIGLKNVLSIGCSRDNDNRYDMTYFLTNEGYIYFCGKIDSTVYSKSPTILDTGIKFKNLETLNYGQHGYFYSKSLAKTDDTVYCLEKNLLKKTAFKTAFDYCLTEKQITIKTIGVNDISSEELEIKLKQTEINVKTTDNNEYKSESDSKNIVKNFNKQFEKLSDLGSGGFGEVVQVKDRVDGKIYAIKIVRMKKQGQLEIQSLSGYQKEVEILSKCSEQFVVKYYDSWIEIDQLFIQMDLSSDNLKNIIQEKKICFQREGSEPMTVTEYFICSHLMKEILECVQYLHESKPPIIHRDLKPANILVNYIAIDGRFLKLCDFGLATFDSQSHTISHTDNVGTLKYVAPEILNGKNGKAIYTTKSDIFSLNCILCDLFDLDINSSVLSIRNNKDLIKKWPELEDIVIQMLNSFFRKRPTCAQLLSNYELWGIQELKESHKKSEKYKESVNQIRKYKNQFFFTYFVEKSLL